MRVKQLLAVSLSVALALPPSGRAQSASAPPLESAAGGARSIPPCRPASRPACSARTAARRAGFRTQAARRRRPRACARRFARWSCPPGRGSGGSLTPQAERRLGERVMREVRRDPDYLDDWLVRDYLNAMAARLAAAAAARFIGGYAGLRPVPGARSADQRILDAGRLHRDQQRPRRHDTDGVGTRIGGRPRDGARAAAAASRG